MVAILKQLAFASCVLFASASANPFRLQSRQQTNLRILPLGDSITFGLYSTGTNGYRLKLESMLEKAAYKIHYIGNNPHAKHDPESMVNYQHDGWAGDTITMIQRDGLTTFNGSAPPANLVLLHAGSNDCIQLRNPAASLRDLATLIDKIHCLSAQSTVVLAQIINNKNNATINQAIKTFNGYIPYLINDRVQRGYRLQGVNMGTLNSTQFAQPNDDRHPSEPGFQSMATNWIAGIRAADQKGFIGPPSGVFSANAPAGSVSGSTPSDPMPGTALVTGAAPPGGVPTAVAC